MRDSFVFYKSFWEAIKELPPEEREKSLYVIMEYALDGKEDAEIKGIPKAVFTLIKPQIDANNKKYENGKKGGRPKQKQDETGNKPTDKQEETKPEPEEKQGKSEQEPNVNVNDNVNDNVNVNDNDEVKKKYGRYQHVFLTTDELEDLIEKYGEHKTNYLIDLLDKGIQKKGYTYNDHYLAILDWEERDTHYKPPKIPKQQTTAPMPPEKCPVCDKGPVIAVTYGAAKCMNKKCGVILNYINDKWVTVA